MSKRFGVITNWCVYENIDGIKKWLNFDEVVDLLNQFQKENEELKENCINYEWYKQYKTLLNENEQLKNRIDNYNTALKNLQDLTERKINENEQLKESVNNLKETIIKITIAYQRKYDRTIVDLVDEVHDEDITDLIKELQE